MFMSTRSGRRYCFVFRVFSRDTVMDDHKLPLMMKHLILKIWSSCFMLLLFSVYHLVIVISINLQHLYFGQITLPFKVYFPY